MRRRRLIRSATPVLACLLLALSLVVVVSSPAAAIKAAPWRWKIVEGGTTYIDPNSSAEIVLYCPAGYRPVTMEWAANTDFDATNRMSEYVDYTGNWGQVRLTNGESFTKLVTTRLNCVHGDDIGTITTVGALLPRSGFRSGGYVDCPSNTRPLSFGADWEGYSTGRRIDFAVPTEGGWHATGYDGEAGAHLYLEVHCVSSAVFQSATYVSVEKVTGGNQTTTVTPRCPTGKRPVNHGAFEYTVGGSVDPFKTTTGITELSQQENADQVGLALITASFGHTVPANSVKLVGRAYCVWASVPELLVYTAPSGEVHSQTVTYSFTGSDPVGESVSFACEIDSFMAVPCTPNTVNTSPTLNPGSHSLTVQVVNDSRQTDAEYAFFTVVIPPGAPTVTASTPTGGAVSVAFTPGASNGGAVSSFAAECASTDGGATGTATGSASPLSVTGLTDGKSYHCRVRATNSAGTGAYSGFGSTVLVADVPSEVTVTGSTPGKESVAVAFTPTGDGGSQITSYGAECSSTDGGMTGTATAAASPVTVSTLSPGATYHCRVRATSAVGTGDYGSFGPDVLVPTAPPGPTVSGMAPGRSSMSVAFTPTGDGGSAITSYDADCASSDGGIPRSATGIASPLAVSPLTAGATYHCRVRATNLAGTGGYGGFGAAVVVPKAPGKPVVRRTKPVSPTSLKVRAKVPDDGGGAVTAYHATCRRTDGGKAGQATGTRPSVTVAKLSPGRTYRCRVRVTNVAGDSPWSGKGAPTTLPAAHVVRLRASLAVAG